MIKEVTVTLSVPADRLAALQAFCTEQEIAPAAAAAAAEPKPKRTRKSKAKDDAAKEPEQKEEKKPAGPSLDDVRAAVGAAVRAKKSSEVQNVLADFGVEKLPDLKKSQYPDVIKALEALVE